jgi:hypothetical protein
VGRSLVLPTSSGQLNYSSVGPTWTIAIDVPCGKFAENREKKLKSNGYQEWKKETPEREQRSALSHCYLIG